MKQSSKVHPNPQLERAEWIDLNGEWDFGFKRATPSFKFSSDYKRAIEIHSQGIYEHKINVPFCIESRLSGIGYTDFVNLVWYRKRVNINKSDKRVALHIGASDYLTMVLVNSKPVGTHKGGYTSFELDITDYTVDGENEIFILCEDNCKSPLVMRGKQSEKRESHGCDYTRTTGIWQSVYLELTPKSYIKDFKIYPDVNNCLVTISTRLVGKADLHFDVLYDGRLVGSADRIGAYENTIVQIELSEKHVWEVGNGQLYDLRIKFGEDEIKSYFGLRSVRLDGFKFLINEKSVFQRLVLDQGFYKDGIYTARNDEEIIRDIELSMSVGFNGARLHQKVFDPRFLYYCDKLGYIVWGEYASWGFDHSKPQSVDIFLNEWSEALERDFNHPSIVGWCPFNETWNYRGKKQYDTLLSTIYDYTKAIDPTRPCIDTSGNFHVKTDIYDVHDYNYDVEFFTKNFNRLMSEGYLYEHVLLDNKDRQKYNGQPTFVSEYGGIKWETDKEHKAWGYGVDVKTEEEFIERYCGLTSALVNNDKMFGFCYTQLYDIEQEQNGLFTYTREKKFSDKVYDAIRRVNTQKAAIE